MIASPVVNADSEVASAASAAGSARRGSSSSAALLLLALLAVASPVATGRYPPILDLPQMLAQVDLAAAVVRGEAPEMELRWLSPNKIAYPVLALARWLGGDAWGPRLAVFGVLALGVAGIFLFARRRGRAPEAALLATV